MEDSTDSDSTDNNSLDSHSEVPERIGAYRITRLIGEGGMGAVFEGVRDEGDFDLRVAIKVIKPGSISDTLIGRFERERQVLAGLNHFGIARLFDGGQLDDGSPYIVMEYIDGAPITRWCEEQQLNLTSRLVLFQDVCLALRHAHQNLIIHYDITPSNVMVNKEGVVKIIDFGIAKPQSNDELDPTGKVSTLESGTFTPGFAAPERAIGAAPTVLSDVYSLGKLLEVMLKGSDVNADLNAILTRATELAPEDRYASVDALNSEVSALLENRPVIARNGGALYQAKKFVSRFPLAAALSTALVVALAGGLLTSLKFADQAEEQARVAQENFERSEYNLGQATLNDRTSQAYADTLQLMFGGEGDVERLTQLLKERWREAHELREEDPMRAAYLSYAIGLHFRDRNDYVTAANIHSAWLDQGYGPEMLQNWGKSALAISYSQLGQPEKALPIMRATEARYMTSYEANSTDHIALASQIALTSNEVADLQRAEQMLVAGLAANTDSRERRFFWNQLTFMRMQLKDHNGAHDAVRKAVGLSSANPLNSIAGKDTALMNLATFEYYRSKDSILAEQLIAKVMDGYAQQRGNNREAGRAMVLEARLLADKGDFDMAISKASEGVAILERFAGVASRRTKEARLSQAYVLALAGEFQEANQLIADLREVLPSAQIPGRTKNNIDLMEVFIIANEHGIAAADAHWNAVAIDKELVERSVADTHLFGRLKALGLER